MFGEPVDVRETLRRKNEVTKPYEGVPLMSTIDVRTLSPEKIRILLEHCSTAGVQIEKTNVLGYGKTKLLESGIIRVEIPEINPYGSDSVAVHELVHMEQYVRGLRRGLTSQNIRNTPDYIIFAMEIGALEVQLKYLNSLPWSLKLIVGYKQAIKEAKQKLTAAREAMRNNIPEGVNAKDINLFDPLIRIFDANSNSK